MSYRVTSRALQQPHRMARDLTTGFQRLSRNGMRHQSRVSPLPARFPTSLRDGDIRKVGFVASVPVRSRVATS